MAGIDTTAGPSWRPQGCDAPRQAWRLAVAVGLAPATADTLGGVLSPDRDPVTGVRSAQVRTLVIVLFASMVAQSFGRFAYAVVLPDVEADLLGGSSTASGFLGAVNLVAYLVGTAATSVASTRVPPESLLRVGLLGSTTGLAVLATAQGLPVAAAGMVLTGLGGSAIWVPSPGIAAATLGSARRGLAIGIVGTGIMIGVALNAPVSLAVGAIGGEGEWRMLYAVYAVVGAAVLAAVVLFLGRSEPPAGVREPVRIGAITLVPGWRPLLLAYGSYGLAYSLFLFFFVATMEEDLGFSPGTAGAVFALMGVVGIGGGLALGRASDRIGRSAALAGAMLAMAVAGLLVPTGVLGLVVVAAVLFGPSFSGVPSVVSAHIADHLSARAFPAAFGAATLSFGIMQIFGPQLGGIIGDQTGSFTGAYLLSAALAAIGMGAALRLPGRR
jgi:predicted MFS family arabinose efflux permease